VGQLLRLSFIAIAFGNSTNSNKNPNEDNHSHSNRFGNASANLYGNVHPLTNFNANTRI
jgi:hypothetical protein